MKDITGLVTASVSRCRLRARCPIDYRHADGRFPLLDKTPNAQATKREEREWKVGPWWLFWPTRSRWVSQRKQASCTCILTPADIAIILVYMSFWSNINQIKNKTKTKNNKKGKKSSCSNCSQPKNGIFIALTRHTSSTDLHTGSDHECESI